MADIEDMKRLESNELDLSRCDFSGAVIKGSNLSNRDFTFSMLNNVKAEGVYFDNCIFHGAQMMNFEARNCSFNSAKFLGMPIAVCNFVSCSFKGTEFRNSVLEKVDLRDSDLRGANFTQANLRSQLNFEGSIVDETTLFDKAQSMRALSSLPIFRFYDYVRGEYVRKDQAFASAPITERTAVSAEKLNWTNEWIAKSEELSLRLEAITTQLEKIEPLVKKLGSIEREEIREIGMGHNNPPEELPTSNDLTEIAATLPVMKEQLGRAPNLVVLRLCHAIFSRLTTIYDWTQSQTKVFVEEAVKGAGKRAGERVIDVISLKAAVAILVPLLRQVMSITGHVLTVAGLL